MIELFFRIIYIGVMMFVCVCVWLQRAKELVLELLAEKDMQGPGGGMGTFNNFDGMGMGGGGPGGMEVSTYVSHLVLQGWFP